MDNFNTMVNGALNRDDLAERRIASRSALNHWFVRNRGVQRNSFPVMYEPTYHIESLQRPVGMNEEHWDPLSEAERRWHDVPAKNQELEDRRQLWQQKSQLKARSRSTQNDFYTQAITAADDYEEQFKSMPRLKAVTAARAKIEQSEIESTAAEKVSNIYQFPSADKKWQQAGNW